MLILDTTPIDIKSYRHIRIFREEMQFDYYNYDSSATWINSQRMKQFNYVAWVILF